MMYEARGALQPLVFARGARSLAWFKLDLDLLDSRFESRLLSLPRYVNKKHAEVLKYCFS